MSKVVEFWKILFNEDEYTCYGDQYCNVVKRVPFSLNSEEEFFCINPLDFKTDHGFYMKETYEQDKPRRADINVLKFRNFMFEMDGIPLELQWEVLQECGIPWSTVVFSGGKSYHAILSLETCLDLQPHRQESLLVYKNLWARIAAKIDKFAREFLNLSDKENVIDKSCRNPSRFSRYPESFRKSKDTYQTVEFIGKRMSNLDFNALIDSCPVVLQSTVVDRAKPEHVIYDERLFFEVASPGLRRAIKYAPFGAPSGMYKELYKLTLWAIDDTNVDKDLLLELLNKYTFKRLVEDHNYPAHKLMFGVDHALKYKGLA